jgi:hypothetical protein
MDNTISKEEQYEYMNKFDIFHVNDWYEDLLNPSEILPYKEFINMIIEDKYNIINHDNNKINYESNIKKSEYDNLTNII